jgi:N-acetylneuraminic acid mutarotase
MNEGIEGAVNGMKCGARPGRDTAPNRRERATRALWLPSAMLILSCTTPIIASEVVGWGLNDVGQGDEQAGLTTAIAIAGGAYHTMALKADGTVQAWGWNDSGQCDVPADLEGVTAIAGGYQHSLALKADGTVQGWGDNFDGQLDVAAGNVTAIAAGGYHTLAIVAGGTVEAFGWNEYGQCDVPADLAGVTAIAAGYTHSLALKMDGTVVAWGDDSLGQVTVPPGLSDVVAVAAGEYHSMALKSDGTVVAWGDDWAGQISVPADLSFVTAIAAGYQHSMALQADGTVVAWGNYYEGQIDVPVDLPEAAAIAAGGSHSLALTRDAGPSLSDPVWTWRGGSDESDVSPVLHQTLGLENAVNEHGHCERAASWTDDQGRLWVFGGNNSGSWDNDLWRYDPVAGMWALFMKDSATGQFGTQGVAGPDNQPSPREVVFAWKDAQGDFWLYGGYGYDRNGAGGYLDDLWKYDPDTLMWTWVKGTGDANAPVMHGVKGVEHESSSPGGRGGGATWADADGRLWLYGGLYIGGEMVCSDLWRFDPASGNWTWMAGATGDYERVYGDLGVADAANTPGNRSDTAAWKDSQGRLWLFGGSHWIGSHTAQMSDLWRYDPTAGQWTWVGGPTDPDQGADYGMQGVEDAANNPAAVAWTTTWTDEDGRFWLFGGNSNGRGELNDLWRFDPDTGMWAWMKGGTPAGSYGTKGVEHEDNNPRARQTAPAWVDAANRLWLLGGESDTLGAESSEDVWRYDIASGNWTWVDGRNPEIEGVSYPPIYRTLAVEHADNEPGALTDSTLWSDTSGRLWLYGGSGPNDSSRAVWRFNAVTEKWALMSGPGPDEAGFYDQPGVYGTLGAARPENLPGYRWGAAAAADSFGRLWLFGGNGFDAYGVEDTLSDLWRFDPQSAQWTWIGGSNETAQEGIYGAKGIAHPDNVPGHRENAVLWIDPSGNVWLFGGAGPTYYNDLWRFDSASGQWAWMSGSDEGYQAGAYGTRGVPHPDNVPGGRYASTTWIDGSGRLWLFGGEGLDANGDSGVLNDLWRYDPATGNWTWMSGSDAVGGQGVQPGVYGTLKTPDSANTPGGRREAVGWTDPRGRFWLFGGKGADKIGDTIRDLNDLWMFDPGTTRWTWMGGSDEGTPAAAHGQLGVAHSGNNPGGRSLASACSAGGGIFWLFGGEMSTWPDYRQWGDLWSMDVGSQPPAAIHPHIVRVALSPSRDQAAVTFRSGLGDSYEMHTSTDGVHWAAQPEIVSGARNETTAATPLPQSAQVYVQVTARDATPLASNIWAVIRIEAIPGFTLASPALRVDRRFNGGLAAVLSKEMQGSDDGIGGDGDEVYVMEADESWRTLFLSAAGKWMDSGSDPSESEASEFELSAGQGYVVARKQPTSAWMTFVGPVGNDGTRTNRLNSGWNLIGLSEGKRLPIRETFASAGPVGGISEDDADLLVLQNPDGSWRRLMHVQGWGAPYDGNWFDLNSFEMLGPGEVLEPGRAYYYLRRGGPTDVRF